MDVRALARFAESLAREAGELLLRAAALPLEIREKGAVDLVTNADQASEALILGRIADAYPDHDVLAEESAGGAVRRASRPLWIVDPLDGTTNFAHGLPIWSVSIACVVDGRPVAGVVHDPSRAECFVAARGEGATLNGSPLRVSSRGSLREALFVTGFPYDVQTDEVDNLDHFARLLRTSRGVRRLGSAAIDLAYVACGRFDGFWELKLHAWDIAAGVLLVEEAGGAVSDFDESPLDLFAGEIVAANPALLPQVARELRQGRRPARVKTPSS